MRQIEISANQGEQRFDKFLQKYLREASKSFIYKMLRKKNITLNGKKAQGNEKLKPGDVVVFFFSEETLQKFCGEIKVSKETKQENFPIIYEDEQILLINKPAGLLSQKAKPEDVSLVELVQRYVGCEPGFSPGICNRLDRNTSGIIVAGKTLQALQKMSELFRTRDIGKYYLAVVKGDMTEKRVVEGYLVKDEKRNKVVVSQEEKKGSSYIKTGYEPLIRTSEMTLLRVHLMTGKPHQIRSHLSSLGHPIVGDAKYGGAYPKIKRQLLHAYEVQFPKLNAPFDKISGKSFFAPIPDCFFEKNISKEIIEKLEQC
ncbi:MAG: RluA family pseudouridine synthase [Eubacterium sp.]